VGSLSVASRDATVPFYDAFIDGMRELSRAQGKNIGYRFFFADGHAERLDALAAELLAQPIDVVVVGPPQALRALQKATATVPIVMANVSNAVGNRFIASLARPGGNITGITAQNEVVLGKLIEQLRAAAPLARRIAVLVNESNPSHRAFWEAAQAACAALGLVPLRVVAGGLLSYAADFAQNYRDAASDVDKILRGAKPADLPVAQPTRYQLALNLKTARALELTMPQSLLLQATEVIE